MLRQDSKFPLPDEKKSFDSPTAHSQRRQLLPDNPQSAGAAYPIHDSLNKDKPEQSAADASTIPAALRSLSPFWKHQHRKIGCLEEIAYLNGWISKEELMEVYEVMKKNQYGQYLKDVMDGKYQERLY